MDDGGGAGANWLVLKLFCLLPLNTDCNLKLGNEF